MPLASAARRSGCNYAQVAGHLNCDASKFRFVHRCYWRSLPIDKAQSGLTAVFDAAPCSWEDVTHTIGTTDTFAKGNRKLRSMVVKSSSWALSRVQDDAPDMATMLGYIFTDAMSTLPSFSRCYRLPTNQFLSCITVDSDIDQPCWHLNGQRA
jgi:glutamate N-acetyltransferase/amino-acid N-acetyltransferase